MSLTYCFSWDEIKRDLLAERKSSVTHFLLVMRCDAMRLPGKINGQCHSLAVGNKMM